MFVIPTSKVYDVTQVKNVRYLFIAFGKIVKKKRLDWFDHV